MLPLAGIKVVEIGQNLAGPFAGQILARLGADVVKVERPEGGDDARGWGPPFLRGAGSSFHAMNAGKRSITVDLRDAWALDWLRNHVAGADVLIQNLRAGVLEELGLGTDAVRALNPRLIYCSLSAFGPIGPLRERPGYEPMMQAFAGLMMVSGDEGGARDGARVAHEPLRELSPVRRGSPSASHRQRQGHRVPGLRDEDRADRRGGRQ